MGKAMKFQGKLEIFMKCKTTDLGVVKAVCLSHAADFEIIAYIHNFYFRKQGKCGQIQIKYIIWVAS